MAEFTDHITQKHADFIKAQPMFFVATACEKGRINLSPKGGKDTFRVFDPNLFGYVDYTGSGNETAAHVKNDGRITVMFNSYTRNPWIVRLYGQGRIIRPDKPGFESFAAQFPAIHGLRQIILVDVESVQGSCGYTVPLMELTAHRNTLDKWAQSKGKKGIADYQQQKNALSIDGLDTGLNE